MTEQNSNLKVGMREAKVRRDRREDRLSHVMGQRQGYQRQRKVKMAQERH